MTEPSDNPIDSPEITTELIDELVRKDPLELSTVDIEVIVERMRRHRVKWAELQSAGAKTRQAGGAKRTKVKKKASNMTKDEINSFLDQLDLGLKEKK